MTADLGRLAPWRWPLWIGITVLGWVAWEPSGASDLGYFSSSARTLISSRAVGDYRLDGRVRFTADPGGLHVFASRPDLHFGPLSLLPGFVTLTPSPAGHDRLALLDVLLVLATVWVADRRCPVLREPSAALACGSCVLITGLWASLQWTHPDVVGAALALMLMLLSAVDGQVVRTGLWWGVAVLWSQVAVLALPALWWLGSRRDRARATALAVGVAVLGWAPFFLADPRTIDAVRARDHVHASSLTHVLGLDAYVTTSSARPIQLIACALVGAAILRCGDPGCALVGVLATRVLIDPTPYSYMYGLLAVALVSADVQDLMLGRSVWPRWSAAGVLPIVAAMAAARDPDPALVPVIIRTCVLTGMLIATFAVALVRTRHDAEERVGAR